MLFDLRDQNGRYPFDISKDTILSETLLLLVNSIREIKLFIRTLYKVTGLLTRSQSGTIWITIYMNNGLSVECTCSPDGVIHQINPEYENFEYIDRNNSFVVFNTKPPDGTYNIPLLAETICYVPPGITFYCQSNTPTLKAQILEYDADKIYLFRDSITFKQGKNCSVAVQLGVITFTGAAGNGTGRFSSKEMNSLWNRPIIDQEQNLVKAGLLSINGQSSDVDIGTSASLNVLLIPSARGLVVSLKRKLEE